MPPALGSFDGLDNVDSVQPPDPTGAVGPNHYVQWVNTSFAIWDKAGNLLYGPAAGNTLWTGFGGPCQTTNDGDPIVLHDHLADRWFMSQLALPSFPFGPFYQCIAVSQTSDPTGAYYRYAFRISSTKLNDYPKFGVWPDAYYLAVNQFNEVTLSYGGQGVVAFERDRMLAGLPAAMVYFDLFTIDPNLGGMLPADLDGSPPPAGAPGYFVQFDDNAWNYTAQDQLQLWRFRVDWQNPEASTFTGPVALPTAPFDSNLCGYNRDCIPQPGTRHGLDAISDRLMFRLQYRNFGTYEALVLNHTVDVGADHAGIRWHEIRDPGGTPVLHQEGTYAPDTLHRWMGRIAMDGAGNLALGFSVAGDTKSPSIRYAGRLVTDPPGTLAQGETELVAGSGSQTDASNRWGDYSTLNVDPTDHCTFWYTNEYYLMTSAIGWRTRIGSFRFPTCTSDLPSVTAVATGPTASEAGASPGVITFTRSGGTEAALTVQYTVGGSATAGVDYVPLPTSATIDAGSATAVIVVTPIDDALVENEETILVTLAADPAYAAGTPSAALVTLVNDDLPPDLVVSALTAPSSAGAGATISVSDTTQNQGAGTAAPSATALYLSTNATLDAGDVPLGNRIVPTLLPAASSTIATTVTIPSDAGVGVRWLIARADDGNALLESQEANNIRARSITLGPDLIVSALTAPSAAAAGAAISVTDTTRNQGAGTAGASSTAIYLSTNATLDAGDALLASRSVSSLAAVEEDTAATAVTIPTGTASGVFYLIARADAADAVGETSETNNTRSRSIAIGADLRVSTLIAPTSAAAGAAITSTDTTTNQGAAAAVASTTATYISANAVLDAGDALLARRPVTELGAGSASTGTTTLTIPAATPAGVHYLIARADDDGAVQESNEGNNTTTRSISIGPDLVVSALTAPADAAAGATISVGETTANSGAGPAGASSTGVYLSTNSTLDAADVLLGSRSVPALGAGGTSATTTTVTIPSGTATGLYYLIAIADVGGVVAESKETNNTRSRPIDVGADLLVSVLTVPATGAAAATISVSDTTSNQGAAAAVASTTAFHLSANSTFGSGDVLIGSRPVPPLGGGGTSSASTPLTIPAATVPGTYYVLGVADAAGVVAESRENNNTAARTIAIGPDLFMSFYSGPSSGQAGGTITVSDTTLNRGGDSAAPSTTAFYLSVNRSVEPGDVLLGGRAIPPLAAGASSTASTALTIPSGTVPGSYFVVFQVDDGDAVAEARETDNTLARVIQITAAP